MFDSVYAKNRDYVYREVAGEYLLIPIRQKLNEANKLYVLNKTGSEVWNRLDGKRPLSSIVSELGEMFEVSSETLQQDIQTLLQDLLSIQAAQETAS